MNNNSTNNIAASQVGSAELVEITIPSDQREGNQASVHRWLKSVGDSVKKNEPILEINTDKVTLEVVAPTTGVLVEILKQPRESCELNEIFGRISSGAAAKIAPSTNGSAIAGGGSATAAHGASPGTTSSPSMAASKNERLSPAVRNVAAQRGMNLSDVVGSLGSGSGAGGRITARDVEGCAAVSGSHNLGGIGGAALADVLVPHTPMRRAIATEMARSVAVAPHVTSVFECDFEAVLAHRAKHKSEFAQRGVKLTVTPYLMQAAAFALKEVPEVNASWHEDHVAVHQHVNLGIATALENSQGGGAGLVVPVVRDVDKLDLFGIAKELQRFTEAGRTGKLTSSDLSGGTFTISNHGVSGSLFAAPIIILQPQIAILGVGKVERRMVVSEVEGREIMEVRSRAYVTLTIDHRALDGFTANRFLTKFTDFLQRLS